MKETCETSDLLVFSHLRWDFVFQRPQHLLTRHARHRRVYYFEEPIFGMTDIPRLHLRETPEAVLVVVPYLPASIEGQAVESALRDLVDELIYEEEIAGMTIWYYNPMALNFSRHLEPVAIIFDKIEELSLFKGAPAALVSLERELMTKADLVFTGGHSLYEAVKDSHHNIHPFPSSIDAKHFSQGRLDLVEPEDQSTIPHPRLGFYGAIDERFNSDLLREMARLRPDFHFVIIGPVVGIDPSDLPQALNIHYLGKKDYAELPLYLSGWDCAIMPIALSDKTRFTNPTKTPEFLSAGKPVVSTSIRDVIHPYATNRLVHIADTAVDFIHAVELAMLERKERADWLDVVDQFLGEMSWDQTFAQMATLEKELPKKKITDQLFIHHITPTSISSSGAI